MSVTVGNMKKLDKIIQSPKKFTKLEKQQQYEMSSTARNMTVMSSKHFNLIQWHSKCKAEAESDPRNYNCIGGNMVLNNRLVGSILVTLLSQFVLALLFPLLLRPSLIIQLRLASKLRSSYLSCEILPWLGKWPK